MKNDKILLTKLIDETEKGMILWEPSVRADYAYSSNYIKWKGEKNITPNKHIAFVLNYYRYDLSECELKVFLINDNTKTREIIYDVDPGFFSFKTKKLLEILIDKITNRDKKEHEICPPVPPLKHVWDQEDSD